MNSSQLSIQIEMPDGEKKTFTHLVLDYTGTLSKDGKLLPGVAGRLTSLSSRIKIIVMTADTFGTAEEQLSDLPVEVRIVKNGLEKANEVEKIGRDSVIAVGNGRNDIPMMKKAGLGIAVIGPEGAAGELLKVASVITVDINDALELVLNPLRLKATLRE